MGGGVIIMAGGTGGHVFPALAVADALRAQGVSVAWMGTHKGLEAKVVPAAGIEMEWISIHGLRGKGVLSWLLAPFRLAAAVLQALRILHRRRPHLVLGMGGFVSGPGGIASWLLRRPLVIHEQNAIAGLTNRLLSQLANKVCEGFPGTFTSRRKVITTGNPVRLPIASLPAPTERWQDRSGPIRLLVIGGSLGAQALNECVPLAVAAMNDEQRPQIWHQTGQKLFEETQRHYTAAKITARVAAFIDDMAEAYAWADLVVCRAGALTVAELAAAGVGAVLVPYPHAVDDHQTRNARFLVDAHAGVLIPQTELTPERLRRALSGEEFVTQGEAQLTNESQRLALLDMAMAARRVAKPQATDQVTTLCMEVANRA